MPTPSTALTPPAQADVREVLDYWFADGLEHGWPTHDMNPIWFMGGQTVDETIRQRFGARVEQAMAGGLTDWEQHPLTRLALVILLDQFTRNVYRGSGKAFVGDARAQALVRQTLDAGEDLSLPPVARVFFYMPLEHAEDLVQQDRCVASFTRLLADAPEALKKTITDNLDYAVQHQAIIRRFGRFPHRNQALQRDSTPQEIEFLRDGPRFGQ